MGKRGFGMKLDIYVDGEWKAGERESSGVGDWEGWKGNSEAWRGRGDGKKNEKRIWKDWRR